jgi:hypothetical protein
MNGNRIQSRRIQSRNRNSGQRAAGMNHHPGSILHRSCTVGHVSEKEESSQETATDRSQAF